MHIVHCVYVHGDIYSNYGLCVMRRFGSTKKDTPRRALEKKIKFKYVQNGSILYKYSHAGIM